MQPLCLFLDKVPQTDRLEDPLALHWGRRVGRVEVRTEG